MSINQTEKIEYILTNTYLTKSYHKEDHRWFSTYHEINNTTCFHKSGQQYKYFQCMYNYYYYINSTI